MIAAVQLAIEHQEIAAQLPTGIALMVAEDF